MELFVSIVRTWKKSAPAACFSAQLSLSEDEKPHLFKLVPPPGVLRYNPLPPPSCNGRSLPECRNGSIPCARGRVEQGVEPKLAQSKAKPFNTDFVSSGGPFFRARSGLISGVPGAPGTQSRRWGPTFWIGSPGPAGPPGTPEISPYPALTNGLPDDSFNMKSRSIGRGQVGIRNSTAVTWTP